MTVLSLVGKGQELKQGGRFPKLVRFSEGMR
jgi:hypothetical protein